jgi:hypothetical protein
MVEDCDRHQAAVVLAASAGEATSRRPAAAATIPESIVMLKRST